METSCEPISSEIKKCNARECIRKIKEINDLITNKEVVVLRDLGLITTEGWIIKTVFQAEDDTITYGTIEIDSDNRFPKHYHRNSVEVFVVNKGNLNVHFLDTDEILTVCAEDEKNFLYVEHGREHVVWSDIPGTCLFFVIVPSDKGYPKL